MTPTDTFELILLLMAAVLVLELVARRLQLPPAAALILGGIALAFIPGMPGLELDPDLALVLFLPPLLMSGAFFTVWRDFRADFGLILQLAVAVVAFTTLVVGAVAHWVMPGLPWAACFALGAIVSPPDAVSAKAVLQRLTLPRRITVLLEGESLVNDATGLVLYRFAVAAGMTGVFSAQDAAISFAAVTIGGVVFGIASGYAASLSFKWLRQSEPAIVVSLLVSWAAYAGAQAAGVSGVLATVACGLVLGWRQHAGLSAETRIRARAVWGVVVFILESLVFIIIGLSLRGVVLRLQQSGVTVPAVLPSMTAIVAAVIGSRFLWIIPATFLPRAFSARARSRPPGQALAVATVMSWAGMRGVVSLAAALALPTGYPGRDVILATTFAVILVTVLVQGATLAPLIRILGVDALPSFATETNLPEAEASARIFAAQKRAVEALSLAEDGSQRHPWLLEQYGRRADMSARFSQSQTTLTPDRNAHFSVVLAAIAAGRAELLRMHRAGEIHDDVLRALETELDLEEVTTRRHLSGR